MPGLLNYGRQSLEVSGQMWDQLAQSESQRNQANEALDNQRTANIASTVGAAAAIGAAAKGFAVGGPIGAGVGLLIGTALY